MLSGVLRSVEKRLEEDNKFGSEVMGLKGIAATVK